MDHLEQQIFEIARKLFQESAGCHDFDHTLRVAANAEKLLAALPEADPSVVRLAALLHDCARAEEDASGGKVDHAALGAVRAKKILLQANADPVLADAVASAIARHRYRGKLLPQSLEEMIVYDADKLDSLGAIGIGRAFHFAGKFGARVHNTQAEALTGKPYGKEDTAFREYLVKLRHVPEKMLTEPGRALAAQRLQFMTGFFAEMEKECASEN
ncbi:MAG: HD domain-containing protein [Victivallaceae bacterium]|nr:HD domain-containing protein [Victivallaceae bacterium]